MNSRYVHLTSLALILGCAACEDADPESRFTAADVTVSAGDIESHSFDEDSVGAVPAGGQSFSGSWAVRAEEGAPSAPNALCQTADEEYPALQLGGEIYADVTVTTRFKPISGETDQAAGIIFRVQDADNYYIVRANALESNLAFYLYGDGGREKISDDAELDIPNGVWQELKLEVRGSRFTAFIDGNEVLSYEDEDATYAAGGVGLWTKADSVTCFDDFVAEAL